MPKIIHYRNKCIGCGICYEQQPELWRMSKKDGRATLLKAENKKKVFVLLVNEQTKLQTQEMAKACPVKIIQAI